MGTNTGCITGDYVHLYAIILFLLYTLFLYRVRAGADPGRALLL